MKPVRIKSEIYERIKELAIADDRTVQSMVNKLLEKAVENE